MLHSFTMSLLIDFVFELAVMIKALDASLLSLAIQPHSSDRRASTTLTR